MLDTGVYQIRNTTNGKVYVGSAVKFSQRWRQHTHLLRKRKHHSRILQNAWNKYGEAAFAFEPLFICAKEMLVFYEQRAIDTLRPKYNAAGVAGSTLGMKHSIQARANNAAAQRGKKMSKETCAKMAAARKGTKVSAETKARMSASKKGVLFSEAHKRALAAARQGRLLSEAHKKAIGEAHAARSNEDRQATREKRAAAMRVHWARVKAGEIQR